MSARPGQTVTRARLKTDFILFHPDPTCLSMSLWPAGLRCRTSSLGRWYLTWGFESRLRHGYLSLYINHYHHSLVTVSSMLCSSVSDKEWSNKLTGLFAVYPDYTVINTCITKRKNVSKAWNELFNRTESTLSLLETCHDSFYLCQNGISRKSPT
jgi:hypothetical protein